MTHDDRGLFNGYIGRVSWAYIDLYCLGPLEMWAQSLIKRFSQFSKYLID